MLLVLAVAGCAVLLSLLTVFNQVKTLGLSWHEAHYRERLESVLQKTAPSPWQFRLLSDTATVATYRAYRSFAASLRDDSESRLLAFLRDRPVGVPMLAIRLAQNLLIFGLAVVYYRKLGIPVYLGLIGISILAWNLAHANDHSDLAINAYTDIILYLLAGIVILQGRPAWVPLIALLGAMNRETSGCIPFMLLFASVESATVRRIPKRILSIGLFALGLYVGVYFSMRYQYGPRDFVEHPSGAVQGMSLLRYNLTNREAWAHMAGVIGLMPVLALMAWRYWPMALKAFFWAIVPAWFVAHFLYADMTVGRQLIVPQVMIFIPGALLAVLQWREAREEPA